MPQHCASVSAPSTLSSTTSTRSPARRRPAAVRVGARPRPAPAALRQRQAHGELAARARPLAVARRPCRRASRPAAAPAPGRCPGRPASAPASGRPARTCRTRAAAVAGGMPTPVSRTAITRQAVLPRAPSAGCGRPRACTWPRCSAGWRHLAQARRVGVHQQRAAAAAARRQLVAAGLDQRAGWSPPRACTTGRQVGPLVRSSILPWLMRVTSSRSSTRRTIWPPAARSCCAPIP